MNKLLFLSGAVLVLFVAPVAAQAPAGWPETIDLLTQERSQAQTCIDLLKSSNDNATIATGRGTYGTAKAEADGVIAGLITALVEGAKPESLSGIQANLEKAGAGLKETCDSAAKAPSAADGNRGAIEEVAKGAIEPMVTAISAGIASWWAGRKEKDKLEQEMIKSQLEAARWPDF